MKIELPERRKRGRPQGRLMNVVKDDRASNRVK